MDLLRSVTASILSCMKRARLKISSSLLARQSQQESVSNIDDRIYSLVVRDLSGELVFSSSFLSVGCLFSELSAFVLPTEDDWRHDKIVFSILGSLEIYNSGYVCRLETRRETWGTA